MTTHRTRTVEIGASRRGLPRVPCGRGAPDNRPAAALPADKAEPPQAEQHLLISLPSIYRGLLLHVLYVAERQAILDHARLKQFGCDDPALDPHGDTKVLRMLIEQQLRQQPRLHKKGKD